MHPDPADGATPDSFTPPAPAAAAPRGPKLVLQELRAALAGIHLQSSLAFLVATTLLIVGHHHGETATFRAVFPQFAKATGIEGTLPHLYWFSASVVLYLALPMLAAALTPNVGVRATGVGLGDRRIGFGAVGLALALFLPIVFIASRFPAFANHYPMCSAARDSWAAFAMYEAAYALYFVAWEYLFRGYLLFSLEPTMGKVAVFAQMMPFAILHFGKPELETFGSVIAGVFLGLLALRTRSFWYGALLHASVAVSMDVFARLAGVKG